MAAPVPPAMIAAMGTGRLTMAPAPAPTEEADAPITPNPAARAKAIRGAMTSPGGFE